MKKIAIFKIIMFSIVSILLIGILIYGLTSKKEGFYLNLGGFLYANESKYEVAKEEVQLLDLDVNEIEVNWIGGNVLVRYSEDTNLSLIHI